VEIENIGIATRRHRRYHPRLASHQPSEERHLPVVLADGESFASRFEVRLDTSDAMVGGYATDTLGREYINAYPRSPLAWLRVRRDTLRHRREVR